MTRLSIERIRIDGGTQARVSIDEDAVASYAENLHELPPIDVYHDGTNHWLADGFHRFLAHKRSGAKTIDCNVHKGTNRDALLHACGANAQHGLRRSREDKRKAVGILLHDEEWRSWPDAKVAQACAVSREFVNRVRTEFRASCDQSQDAPRATGSKTAISAESTVANPAAPEPAVDARRGYDYPATPDAPPEARQRFEQIKADGGEPRYMQRGGTVSAMDTSKIGKAKPPVEKAPAAPSTPKPPPGMTDTLGKPIEHAHVREAFEQVPLFKSLMARVSALKREFEELCTAPGGAWASRQQKQWNAEVNNLHAILRFAAPHAVCPSCGGRKCEMCQQTGWMPEDVYKNVPSDIRGRAAS